MEPASTSTAEPVSEGTRRALAIGIILAITAFAFDALAISAAMPEIADDLGGVALYGAAFSAFFLAMLVSLAVAGPLADARGPRPVLGTGLGLFTAGLVLGGAAPTMEVVVASRAVQGLGGGTILACAYVVVGRAWDDGPDRARVFALMAAAWIVPGLVAPYVAGLVAEHLTWRLVFWGIAPVPAVAAVLAMPALGHLPPVVQDEAAARADLARRGRLAVLLGAGGGLVLAGLAGRTLLPAAVLTVAGTALLVPPLRYLLPRGTFRALPVLPAIVAARAMLNWMFFGTEAFIPFALTEVRGLSVSSASLVLTVSALAWSSAAWVQARRSGPSARRPLAIGFVLMGIGTSAVLVVPAFDAIPVVVVFAGWVVGGAGMGVAFNATSVAALAVSTSATHGGTASSLQIADALSTAVSTALGGAIVGAGERGGWDPATTAVVVFAVMLAAVVPGLLAVRRLPAR